MGVLVPVHGGWVDSRIPDIARELYRRDPNCELRAECDPGGKVKRYALFWRSPEGKWHWCMSWQPGEEGQILADVARADRTAAGHTPVVDEVEKHDRVRHKAESDQFQENFLEMTQHAAFIQATKDGLPRTRFYVNGRKKG